MTLLSDEDKDVMTAYGAYGPKNVYGKEIVGVIRSTFVVDVGADGSCRIVEAQYKGLLVARGAATTPMPEWWNW